MTFHLQVMASKIRDYGAFLHNYAHATETVRRCSSQSSQFAEITRDIRLRGYPKGPGLSLEDLLHKPVARVQKNALVLHVIVTLIISYLQFREDLNGVLNFFFLSRIC